MKNLFWVFLVVLTGCSSAGDYPRAFFEGDSGTDTSTDEEDAGSDSSVDADSDSDTDTDSDTESDSGTGIPCDAGACCVGGEVAVEGTECISDVLPEDVSEIFSPEMIPMQFRCIAPDTCGGGEERRKGHTVCDGLSSSCFLENIAWGSWEVTFEESPAPYTVCNPMKTNGAIVWSSYADQAGASFLYCNTWMYAGCEAGACIPAFSGSEEECANNMSAFFCGSCTHNCYENGGDSCNNSEDGYICECGTFNPACDEGFRCVWDNVVADFACIPE
jgi:hypothetical protein